jgi:hypothetical protein
MALEVIGPGLPRTVTMSLKLALEQLGFGPCHHASEFFSKPHLLPLWEGAFDGRPDWDATFAGYRSTTDSPGCDFFEELAAFYPQAKVILTTRDAERWHKSVESTLTPAVRQMLASNPFAQKMEARSKTPYSADSAKMIAAFHAHNERVVKTIPAERLLVFRIGDGWEPLCSFLGVPVPLGEYPHANEGDKFEAAFTSQFERAFGGKQ